MEDEILYDPTATPNPKPAPEHEPAIPVSPPANGTRLRDDPVLADFRETVGRLPKYVGLVGRMLKDDRVPLKAKGVVGASGAYLVSPIDLVPGLIPVYGQADDLLVLLMGIRQGLRMCPAEVADDLLATSGLTMGNFDHDLKATVRTVRWLTVKGAKAGTALAMRGGRRLKAMVDRTYQRIAG